MKRNNKIQYSNTNRNTDWLTSPRLRPLGDNRTILIGRSGKTLRDRTTVVCVSVCGVVSYSSSVSCLSFCILHVLAFYSHWKMQHTCKRTATHTDTHSHRRMLQVVLMFCPGQDQDRRDGARRKLVDCLTTQCFRFCSGTPLLPLKILKVRQSTLHWSVLLDHPIGFRMGEEWAVAKTEKKRGPNRWQHTARSKKRYVLVKNKHVWCLSGALQQKGKKEMSLFSIIIQTCSTKTTNHIHKPLIGTVYLSENIIEPKNKKSCFSFFFFFKSVSW